MKVQSINNEPVFGIKLVNKKTWNPKVIETFEKSKLLKEIDAKYPKASAHYHHFNEADFDMVNCEDIYTTLFGITLEPGKIFSWNLTSHDKNVPDTHLKEALKTLTLADIEKKAVAKVAPIATIEITEVKKPNIFQKLFNKIFG